ncbi:transcriptional regulator [Streptococcus agalactiae]
MALSIRRKKAENILTISQLANLLDIHRTTLSRLLLGNCKVNKSTYEKLVNWLVEDL